MQNTVIRSGLSTAIMNGFVIVELQSNEVAYFGSRSQCREWRRSQTDPTMYSGAQRVNANLPLN